MDQDIFLTISDAAHYLEFEWQASSAAGANNGYLALLLDGALQQTLTGLDNDARLMDYVRLGVGGVPSGTSDTEYFDAFESRRTSCIYRSYYFAGGQMVGLRVTGDLTPANNGLFYLLGDHLGSTSVTANGTTGALVAELRYKPWGETRYTWNTTPTSKHFTGQIEDAGIGLYFYGSRYYDSSLGRFISADSVVSGAGDPQALNRYTFRRHYEPQMHIVYGHQFEAMHRLLDFDLLLFLPRPLALGNGFRAAVLEPGSGFQTATAWRLRADGG